MEFVNFPMYKQVSALVCDFDGVFTDNTLLLDEHGNESVRASRSDGLGMELLRRFKDRVGWDLEIFVLSREKNPVVTRRCEKLGLDCYAGIRDKRSFLRSRLKLMDNLDGKFVGLMYLGNDLNDLGAMTVSQFSVCPADAHPRVRAYSDYVIECRGGDGVLRALVEKLIRLEGFSDLQLIELLD
jgi:3-deoxy-D-manno-octulosonate 8-phosphate phosphatase (KDO 8-P phosphatase)